MAIKNTLAPLQSIRENRTRDLQILLISLLGFLPLLGRYAENQLTNDAMVGNVTNVWFPLATRVLNGGELYLSHWDNKPPLFQFLNIAVAATDHYMLVFYVLIGLANTVTALLIWRLCIYRGHRFGFIAAMFYVGTIPLLTGTVINPRQFAAIAIVGAFLTLNPTYRGILLAVAGLFSQFSVLVIPVAVLDYYHQSDSPRYRWFLKFSASGVATVVASFSLVAVIWSPDAAATGLEYSFGATSEYVARYSDRAVTVWAAPVDWVSVQVTRTYRNLVLLGFAGVGALRAVRSLWSDCIDWFGVVAVIATALLFLPTLIRPTPIYWLPALPFLSFLAGYELQHHT